MDMSLHFANYNLHLTNPEKYWERDMHLHRLQQQPYIYQHPLITELPRQTPGVYTIGGGRQIGKTTLLKQWIAELLQTGISPQSIIFLTGELIDDHHILVDLLSQFVNEQSQQDYLYIIIDEVTYIKGWDRAIKFAADAGFFQRAMVVLTGSDLMIMQAARMTFPGRRGQADQVDFHIYSLSFKDFLQLKLGETDTNHYLQHADSLEHDAMKSLYDEFQRYLMHGGYLTAINDMAREGRILPATMKVYSDWVRGDMLKRDKQESYLREILLAIIKRYNKQVTWHALADAISIDSHKTVSDYCCLLEQMDALFIQKALLLDKLVAAPKKARKLSFTDPFIYHAIKQWLQPVDEPFARIQQDVLDSSISADLVESVVSNQFRRFYPTYYIKAAGEIDVAYVKDNRFWPVEVKWRNQLRPNDLKLITQFKRASVFAKVWQRTQLQGIPIEPLPLALLKKL